MPPKFSSVLLITIDCLRADHLGSYGYHRTTSPTIDRLAASGTRYKTAISRGGGTPEAFPTIMASVSPALHQDDYNTVVRHNTTLAEVLRNSGFATAAFHSNPYISRAYGYNKGFDTFDDGAQVMRAGAKVMALPYLRPLKKAVTKVFQAGYTISLLTGRPPILRAEAICNLASKWLTSREKSFFLWMHFMDAHQPYMPPPRHVRIATGRSTNPMSTGLYYARKQRQGKVRLAKEAHDFLVDCYDGAIHYVDTTLKEFFETNQDALRECLIVISADHGDAFGEHGYYGHFTLHEAIVHVPLIISSMNGVQPAEVTEVVTTQDIGPTIIDMLGLPPVTGFRGKSLVDLDKQPTTSSRGVVSVAHQLPGGLKSFAYRDTEWKYIRWESDNGSSDVPVQEELYHLSEDPAETRNLSNEQPDKREAIEHLLKEELANIRRERRAESLREKARAAAVKMRKGPKG